MTKNKRRKYQWRIIDEKLSFRNQMKKLSLHSPENKKEKEKRERKKISKSKFRISKGTKSEKKGYIKKVHDLLFKLAKGKGRDFNTN